MFVCFLIRRGLLKVIRGLLYVMCVVATYIYMIPARGPQTVFGHYIVVPHILRCPSDVLPSMLNNLVLVWAL